MAVTMTLDKQLRPRVTRQKNELRGSAAFTTYAGGGVTWTFPQFKTTRGVELGSVSGYIAQYDFSNTKMKLMFNTGGVEGGVEIASDTSLASWTAIPFVAWGTSKL